MTSRRTHLFLSLSLLLLLVLCFALLPAQALAAGDFDTPRELEVLEESPAMLGNGAGTITASTLYLKPNSNWTMGGARFAMYVSNSGTNAYAWADMSDAGDGYYSAAVPTGSWTNVMFARMEPDNTENGWDNVLNQTSNLCPDSGTNCYTIADGAWSGDGSWSAYGDSPDEPPSQSGSEPGTEPSEPGTEESSGESAFYLVGSMTEWQTDDAYLLTRNEAEETAEYVLQAVELSEDDVFAIVETNAYIPDFTPKWYPEGNNNYEVTADGTYDVYFRPNYDGDAGWFEGCIYLVESEQGPQTPDVYVLAGTDNFIPSGWYIGQDSPVMTEGDNGIYSCTVENVVAVENAQYQFKVVQLPGDDSVPIWHGLDGGNQNVAFSLSETCDVTVTYDPDTGEITVSGDGVIKPSTQLSAIYAVGAGKNGFLNDVSWNPAAEANLMTEVADGVYQITYYEIDTDETDPYEFKFTANGDWAVNWGIESSAVYDVNEAEAVLNEDLIYNARDIYFSLENCKDDYVDVTLKLDLSQWDADTQTGAKFSIIVGSEPATEQPTQQPTEPLTEQPTEQPTVEPQTEAYYLVGTMNGWSADNAYKLTCLDESEGDEYILRNVQLTTDDSFKILYSSDGSSYGMWYPEGMGNSFGENGEIVEDGTYDVYFRPNYDGGENWFYNCIYVVASEEPTVQPNTITVYFVDNQYWGTPNIYYRPNGGEWLGVAMTFSEYNDYGEPVYKATIPAGTAGISFISNGNQTVDITSDIADGAMWYTTRYMNEDGRYIVNRAEHPSEEPVFGEPDFTLPKDIKSIEASAFESADMSVVYIPDGCESIGVNAFRYCTSLRQIRIPASVTTIDQTAFTGCENVVVFGAENSRAQEIAEYYHFTFIAENS